MVVIRDMAVLAAAFATSNVAAAALANPLDAIADLHRRDVTVTVTVTATTCEGSGYPSVPATYPTETPYTSIATASLPSSGGYSTPSLTPTSSATPATETTPNPPTTVPTSVAPPAFPSTSPTPIVNTTPIESTSTETTTPVTSSSESVATTSTSVVSTASEHTHASTSATPSIPPAVGSAGKLEWNTGALAVLALAVLY